MEIAINDAIGQSANAAVFKNIGQHAIANGFQKGVAKFGGQNIRAGRGQIGNDKRRQCALQIGAKIILEGVFIIVVGDP